MADASGKPFIKWPGGKRWLAPALVALLSGPGRAGNYIEPFLGGGAVFFAGSFQRPRLSDTNQELISAFKAVRNDVEGVIRDLRTLPVPSPEAYSLVATQAPQPGTARAARFLYLNRLAFNGVWRVNARGVFNVPYGHRPPVDLVAAAPLRACAAALQDSLLQAVDYLQALKAAEAGDVVYCDPPYTVSHNNNGFIRYNETLFSWADQQALAARAGELSRLGVHVAVTNAAHHDVLRLYPLDDFHAFRLVRTSRMASDVTHRRPQAEMLFVSRQSFGDRRRAARGMRSSVPAGIEVELLR
jgi:DNA adenine methylase